MFEKTYLSVSVSRALQVEFPVGDAFGGPAYGELAMPVVAVVAAAWGAAALGGAVTVLGTAAIGSAAWIGAAFTAIASVGAITAGIGVITGNDKLVKIGSVMGLVGGVGMLGASAGIFGATNTLGDIGAGVNAGEVTGAAITQGDIAAQGVAATTPIAPPSSITGSVIPPTSSVADAASEFYRQPTAESSSIISSSAPTSEIAAPGIGAAPSKVELVTAPEAGKGVGQVADNWFSKFTNFVTNKDNAAIVKIGGDFIGGYFDKNKQAQADLAEAQAALARQQLENMNRPMPIPIPGQTPNPYAVTGSPVYNAPYVNTKGAASVTGKV